MVFKVLKTRSEMRNKRRTFSVLMYSLQIFTSGQGKAFAFHERVRILSVINPNTLQEYY